MTPYRARSLELGIVILVCFEQDATYIVPGVALVFLIYTSPSPLYKSLLLKDNSMTLKASWPADLWESEVKNIDNVPVIYHCGDAGSATGDHQTVKKDSLVQEREVAQVMNFRFGEAAKVSINRHLILFEKD